MIPAWSSVWCNTLKGDTHSIGQHIHHFGTFITLAQVEHADHATEVGLWNDDCQTGNGAELLTGLEC